MTLQAVMYVDTNQTIYVTDRFSGNTVLGSTLQMEWGLADMNELSGQSTLFINKVRFRIEGYVEENGINDSPVELRYQSGVTQRDLSVTYTSIKDFQDYKAWPLKNGYGHLYPHSPKWDSGVVNDPGSPSSKFVKSFTYTPRKALLLNREQNLVLSLRNNSGGCPVNTLLSMEIQCKRGE